MPNAHDLAYVLFVLEAVARQRIQRDEAFDEHVLQLDEEPEARGGNDQGVELVADPVDHELYLLPFDQLTLGFGSATLGFGRLIGDRMQIRLILLAVQMRAQNAVNDVKCV
jgi:hypothetical protein